MANRLAGATSPYLLQHAENPVDWWEWGPEALEEARRRDLPIFLSIGYSACHWCHVMAHESFEDPETASLMNAHFVCIKVDREERPDIDAVYMTATQAMTGHGGWPMSCFLTPSGEPFYCGTYFPKVSHPGMPSFSNLLQQISSIWRERREDVLASGHSVTEQLRHSMETSASGNRESDTGWDPIPMVSAAVVQLAGTYDEINGGFGRAPKFPPSMSVEFLLRHHSRTGDELSLMMATKTLEKMCRGGIYDQLVGGFSRYSVDGEWQVPHFEKMLYDNALLIRVYAHWWRLSQYPMAKRVVEESIDWLLTEMRTPEGLFASALDADSDAADGSGSHEGAFYVWSKEEIEAVLEPVDQEWACSLLDVRTQGNFERGKSTLQLLQDPDDWSRWSRIRGLLFEERKKRPRPERDDKIVASWNGLAIAALADAAGIFERSDWLDAARVCARRLIGIHLEDGQLMRVSRDGKVGVHAGVLEDYANVAEGLMALVQVDSHAEWLPIVDQLLHGIATRFGDGEGGFFDTADDAEVLVLRPRDPSDNATPSGWSATAHAFLTASALMGSAEKRLLAERALQGLAPLMLTHPRFSGWALATTEALLDGPLEVAIVGDTDATFTRAARMSTRPGLVMISGAPDQDGFGLLASRPIRQNQATVYICRGFVCDEPIIDLRVFRDRLSSRD
jgi:uncharacterized protein